MLDAESWISDLIARTLDIADKHEKYEHKFATKLRKATPNLYTFVNHPGMDPTNNEAERGMRPVAIRRPSHYTLCQNLEWQYGLQSGRSFSRVANKARALKKSV